MVQAQYEEAGHIRTRATYTVTTRVCMAWELGMDFTFLNS